MHSIAIQLDLFPFLPQKKRRKGSLPYVDYDRVDDATGPPPDDGYDDMAGWGGGGGGGYQERGHHRDRSRYDSPYRSNGSADGSPGNKKISSLLYFRENLLKILEGYFELRKSF